MLKQLTYGIAGLAIGVIVAGVTMARGEGAQAPKQGSSLFTTIDQPRMMTKNDLFTQGRSADVVDIQQVWAAYGFYVDSANGKGIASLYTSDGIVRHFWNDKGTKWEPHGGAGTFQTPYGTTRGGDCVLRGHAEIEKYYNGERPATPWPAWGHHTSPNSMVKISDDGKSAVLTTTMLIASVTEKGEGRVTTGMYRNVFRKTDQGWQIAEQNNYADRPRGTARCDANGNLPRLTK